MLFLSGGLDSSIIVKTASMYNKEHKLGKINTYSVEYRDNEKYFQKSNFQPTPDYEFISMMSKMPTQSTGKLSLTTRLCATHFMKVFRQGICRGMLMLTRHFCSSAKKSSKTTPLHFQENVPMNFSADIRGITTMKYFLMIVFRGQKVRIFAGAFSRTVC